MTTTRLAIVGCGDIARYTALLGRFTRNVSLTACCDIDADRAKAFAGRHRIPGIFSEYQALLRDSECDAVYLAVPHYLHYEMILAAVHAEKSVLVEKPVTRTLDEARRLLSEIGDAKVGVNYQYRYDRGCHALARAIREGALGAIHSVRINVPWRRTRAYFEKAPWHRTIAHAGGGTLITQGSHFLDIVLWALDEPTVRATGFMASPGFDVEVDTLMHGTLQTRSGTLITITSTMAAAVEQAVTIEAYGEEATAVYTNRPWSRVSFHGKRIARAVPPERGVHALQRSLAGFARWVGGGASFLTPAASTLPVLAAVDALYRAARSGNGESVASAPTV